MSGEVGPTGAGVMYGFVPDGVAAVTIAPRATRRPVTGRVADNMFFIFEPANSGGAIGGAKTIIWRDAAGHTIKTIDDDPCLQFHQPATNARCERTVDEGPPLPAPAPQAIPPPQVAP